MPYYHDGASSNWHTYQNVQILNPYREVFTAIYVQNGTTQLTQNIMVEDNEIVGAFKTWEQYIGDEVVTEEDWEYLIFGADTNNPKPAGHGTSYDYYSRIDASRYLYQQNNTVYDHPEELFTWAGYVLDMIDATGSTLCKPDAEAIVEEMIPIYDQWYEDLEEAYNNG